MAVQAPYLVPTRGPGADAADVAFRPAMGGPHEWGELEALAALAATDKPVLAIGAEYDSPTPPAAARRIADTAPTASC